MTDLETFIVALLHIGHSLNLKSKSILILGFVEVFKNSVRKATTYSYR